MCVHIHERLKWSSPERITATIWSSVVAAANPASILVVAFKGPTIANGVVARLAAVGRFATLGRMGTNPNVSSPYEAARQELLESSPDLLAAMFAERFNEQYAPEGLRAGKLRDRVSSFFRGRVRKTCDEAAQIGKDVWEALHDERTAHSVERFALVCGFFVSHVLKAGHWPAHEVAALVLLLLRAFPRTDKSK